MFIQDLEDLRDVVDSVSNNYNYIETSGMWDLTHTCIFCRNRSMNSISDIKHDENCVSKRLIHLYDSLSDEIYKMEGEN